MKLIWNNGKAEGDLGIYTIMKVQDQYVSYWKPFKDKGYRVYSIPTETIEGAKERSQIMEDDMTGVSLMTNERWEAFLRNVELPLKEVYECMDTR